MGERADVILVAASMGAGDEAAKTRADLLTPLIKAYGTDVGVEVTGGQEPNAIVLADLYCRCAYGRDTASPTSLNRPRLSPWHAPAEKSPCPPIPAIVVTWGVRSVVGALLAGMIFAIAPQRLSIILVLVFRSLFVPVIATLETRAGVGQHLARRFVAIARIQERHAPILTDDRGRSIGREGGDNRVPARRDGRRQALDQRRQRSGINSGKHDAQGDGDD